MDFQTLFCYVLLSLHTLKYSNKSIWGLSCIMQLDNLIIHPFHPFNAGISVQRRVLLQTSLSNESAPRRETDGKFLLTFHLNNGCYDLKKTQVLYILTPLERSCIKDGLGNLSTYKNISELPSTFIENI